MNTLDNFKKVLNSFFTSEHCNGKLKDEEDFQEKVALHLKDNGYYIIRELHIDATDWPLIQSELHQEYIEIDIVAYKDNSFFPVELKFQDKAQSDYVTEAVWQHDADKIRILYKTFKDIPCATRGLLSNDSRVWERFNKDFDWEEIDGCSNQNMYKYIWRWWHDQSRDSKGSFVSFWDRTVQKRIEDKTKVKKGDTLFSIESIENKEKILFDMAYTPKK